MTDLEYLFIFGIIILLFLALFSVLLLLWIMYQFRDRSLHSCDSIDRFLVNRFANIDGLFYRIMDRLAGTQGEVLSKRKVRELLK